MAGCGAYLSVNCPDMGLRQVVVRLLPPRVKGGLKVLLGSATAVDIESRDAHARRKFSCPVCNAQSVEMRQLPFFYFRELDKYEHVSSPFRTETLNLEYYSCAACGATDRERFYALYFRTVLKPGGRNPSVLEIAPAPALTKFLREDCHLQVRTADLFMPGVDDVVDVTDMKQYGAGQFDVFICSHVLEHVPDDIKAMRELFRVLKPGGWGIAMVPISLALDAIHEDPSITDEGERWKYFGQNDHVRMYSKRGFVERLSSVGFTVSQLDRAHFGPEVFERHAIHPRSVLYVVTK